MAKKSAIKYVANFRKIYGNEEKHMAHVILQSHDMFFL